MKYGMPRKIDDIRRWRLIKTCIISVAVVSVAWAGFDAWMRSYRERRERLGAISREGEAFLERFDLHLRGQGPQGLEAARNRLRLIAHERPEKGGVGDERNENERQAQQLADYIDILLAEETEQDIAGARADLKDSLAELKVVESLVRPSRDMAAAAERHFAAAQARAAATRAQVVEWREATRRALEEAKAIEGKVLK